MEGPWPFAQVYMYIVYNIDYYTALKIKIITHDMYYRIILESDVNMNSVSVHRLYIP